MDIYKILIALLDKPNAPKFYRELKTHFENNNMIYEASSIGHLIEKKFEKKNEQLIDNSFGSQKQ
jgi:hypothetical protein